MKARGQLSYECALHVIDPKLIREVFLPRVISTDDELFPNNESASRRLAEARAALRRGDAYAAAPETGSLALAFCSDAGLPHHSQSGWCLALWPTCPPEAETDVPKKFFGSVLDLLRPLADVSANLRREIARNEPVLGTYTTGIYISAEKVPDFRKWFEKRIERTPKSERHVFRGAQLVLAEAEHRGLAYWEGSGGVAPHRQLRPPGREYVMEWPWRVDPSVGYFDGVRMNATEEFLGETWPPKRSGRMIDLSRWPPDLGPELPAEIGVYEYVRKADGGRGAWLISVELPKDAAVGSPNNAYTFTGAELRSRDFKSVIQRYGFSAALGRASVTDLVVIDDVVVGELDSWSEAKNKEWPVVAPLLGGDFESCQELAGDHLCRLSNGGVDLRIQSATLADGSAVLLLGTAGFERRDGRWVKTFDFSNRSHRRIDSDPRVSPTGRKRYRSVQGTYPFGIDGFYAMFDHRLRRVRRGAQIETLLPTVINGRELSAGPGSCLVLHEYMPKSGRLGVIFDPDADTYWHIEREHFPFEEPDNPYPLLYASKLNALVWPGSGCLWGCPLNVIMNGSRYRGSTGKKLRA